MDNDFQDLLESLAHAGECSEPYPLDQAPYGATAVQLHHRHANPALLGALLMEEAITARSQMDEHTLYDILGTTQMLAYGSGFVLYWPEEKFSYDR